MENLNKRTVLLVGLIGLAIAISIVLRLIPHIPNFAPIAAIALFSGAYFMQKKWAIGITFLALFASDLVLQIQYWNGIRDYPGFYPSMLFVYGAFFCVLLFGFMLRNKVNILSVAGATLGGSVAFFLISNFGVWLSTAMYSKTFAGLIECYVAGIPFYRGTFFGDIIYTTALFGTFAYLTRAKDTWQLAKVKVRK